jgi:membrane protease YdiL (CAAX protease family)
MRAFARFLGAILIAGLIGAALAYPAYELTSRFASWPFHRVASRIAMLVLAFTLFLICRHDTRRDFGYGLPWRRFLKLCLIWGAVGVATAAAGAAFLLSTHLRIGVSYAPTMIFTALGSGIAVALIEETVFRGAMHTAIERESGAWMAALLTAPLFAVLHFVAKVRIAPQDVGWGSGFDLLLLSFAPLGHPALVLDAFLSWLTVGLILSLTRVLTGNIAVAIGLHAGWVVVLRMLQLCTVGGSSPAYSAWVSHFDGLLGLWLLPWGLILAAALWLTRALWVPPARAG